MRSRRRPTTSCTRSTSATLAASRRRASHWMSDLASDPRARHVNDLVTIHVLESLSATGSGRFERQQEIEQRRGTARRRRARRLRKLFPDHERNEIRGLGRHDADDGTDRVDDGAGHRSAADRRPRRSRASARSTSTAIRSLVMLTRRRPPDRHSAGQHRSVHVHRPAAHPVAEPGSHQGQPAARLPGARAEQDFLTE